MTGINLPARKRGTTFIELMIAMVLFALLMWPLYQIVQFSLLGSLRTGDLTSAINVASELIELFKNKPFNSINLSDPKMGLEPVMDEQKISEYLAKNFNNKYPVKAGKFTRTLEITPLDEVETARGKEFKYVQVVVKVYWKNKSNDTCGPATLFTLVPNENIALR